VFLADRAAIEDDLATSAPRSALEPVVLLALMARETSRVGLVVTLSTTYNYPYTVARQFRALDLVSGGRIGWNAVTTSSPAPLRRLPGNVTDLDRIRVQRCDRVGGVIHEYRLVA